MRGCLHPVTGDRGGRPRRGGAQAELALSSSCQSALIYQSVSFGGVTWAVGGPSCSGGKGKGAVADFPGRVPASRRQVGLSLGCSVSISLLLRS